MKVNSKLEIIIFILHFTCALVFFALAGLLTIKYFELIIIAAWRYLNP